MSVEIREEGNLLVGEFHGVLARADFDACVRRAEDAIRRHKKIRILIRLENFGGWERGVDWGDVSFAFDHDQDVERMAIVGDEHWKEEAFAFTAAPFRTTQIEFFSRQRLDAARAWLKG
jgi:hypothetical protein